MKALNIILVVALVAGAVAVPLFIRYRNQDVVRSQVLRAERFAAESKLLSSIVAKQRSPQSLSTAELSELLKLRSEVGHLRAMLGETNKITREIRQIRDRLPGLAVEKETGASSATALLSDQRELRLARVAMVKEWLATKPTESIPELQFLNEDDWIKGADWTRVTEDEFSSWLVAQRANAEMKFGVIAFRALKQYLQAYAGRFPTRVSELKPFFETPIEDAILQRYDVVPSKNMSKFFAEHSGSEWVITPRVPVTKRDPRVAIGVKGPMSTGEEGRWDPVP